MKLKEVVDIEDLKLTEEEIEKLLISTLGIKELKVTSSTCLDEWDEESLGQSTTMDLTKQRVKIKKTGDLGYANLSIMYTSYPPKYDFVSDDGEHRYISFEDIELVFNEEGKEK